MLLLLMIMLFLLLLLLLLSSFIGPDRYRLKVLKDLLVHPATNHKRDASPPTHPHPTPTWFRLPEGAAGEL